MALHGFASALRLGGLDLSDVRIVETGVEPDLQVRTEVLSRRRGVT